MVRRSTGEYGLLYETKVSRRARRCVCRQLSMALRRAKWCPDLGNSDAVGMASPLRSMFEEMRRGGGLDSFRRAVL